MVSAREFIEENLVIRTKDARIVPLRLNPAQERLYAALEQQRAAGRPMRVIILKARQLGFSTLAEALIFQRTATRENVNSLVVAHREDSTANLFKMSKLFFERLPEELRPLHRGHRLHRRRHRRPAGAELLLCPGRGQEGGAVSAAL